MRMMLWNKWANKLIECIINWLFDINVIRM